MLDAALSCVVQAPHVAVLMKSFYFGVYTDQHRQQMRSFGRMILDYIY